MQDKDILNGILTIQALTLVSVIFNIFVARQVFSFVFLTFIPGYLLLKVFKIENLGSIKTALLSVGVSLAFLMFLGLLLNTLLPLVGFTTPLSTFFIVVFTSSITIVLAAVLSVRIYSKGETPADSAATRFKLSPAILLLISILFLTVFGAELANVSNNTSVLMFLVVAISSFVVLCTLFRGIFPSKIYPLAIFAIAFFLLFSTTLISNYLIGADVHLESYFAQLTANNSIWNWTIPNPYNGMLSVTILPTVYSKFMNLDITWVFKLVYPLIYALVPLALYLAYRKQTNPLVAFLAVFFFMSMDTFYLQMLGLAREMIGELFLALLILLLVDDNLSLAKRRILFVIFSIAMIVSHYSLAYIFIFYLVVAFALLKIFKQTDYKSPSVITPTIAIGFVVTTLAWNLFVSTASFGSLKLFVSYVFGQIQSFAQPPGVGGLMPSILSPLHEVSEYLFLLLQGLIVIGFLGLILGRKRSRFSLEYKAMCVASLAVLLMTMLIPSFAAGLNMTRFYHITLFFLAPLCVTGGQFILSFVADLKAKIFSFNLKAKGKLNKRVKQVWVFLIVILLVSFFLFQVGFIYEIAGDSTPTSISLSKDRMNMWTVYLNQLYIEPQEVVAAKWLSTYENNGSLVYADSGGKYLISYGLIPYQNLIPIDSMVNEKPNSPVYFVFGKLNVVDDEIIGYSGTEWNMTAFSLILSSANKIYSNGESDIYYGK
jgi:uncharacterized membrane protein